jgi:Fe-S-cluster containining protein
MSNRYSLPGKSITACIRCGTCCEKGGPSFHGEDKHLIEKGTIHTRHLYTIRQGELARDNVQDRLRPVPADIIKIKGQKDSWTCTFFNTKEKTCRIYDQRPLECRKLKCWDTTDIESTYYLDRLTRKDLLAGIEGLWDLIQDHEQRCAYEKLTRAINDLGGEFEGTAIRTIITMVRYDTEIRDLVVAQGVVENEMTDFLFGRPLAKTIQAYGYKVKVVDGKDVLAKK